MLLYLSKSSLCCVSSGAKIFKRNPDCLKYVDSEIKQKAAQEGGGRGGKVNLEKGWFIHRSRWAGLVLRGRLYEEGAA